MRIQAKKRISDYKAFSKEDFSKELLSYGKNITVTGNALERYGEFLKNECPGNNILDKHFWYPRGYALACIAEKMAASGETKAFSEIDAFYMRKSEAEETRERKLKDGQ